MSFRPNTPHTEVARRQTGLISERKGTRLRSACTPVCLKMVCFTENKIKVRALSVRSFISSAVTRIKMTSCFVQKSVKMHTVW